jgi:hypothetical protein
LACLQDLGAVPRAGVYDNEGALVSRRGGKANLSDPFQRFRGILGMKVIVLRPRDPEAKGVVERHNGYLETSFLPGRRFSSPQDFNAQLTEWLERANRRVHATLRCRPIERFEEDRAAMMPLPPVLPDTAWHHSLRLGRDHYVRVGTSVHPKVVGRRIEIAATASEILVTCAGEVVALHPRSWAKHRTVTDPMHDRARRELIGQHRLVAAEDPDEVEVRDLSVYDGATGVA